MIYVHLLIASKFSETCIKGHRSSGCKHTDRALYEIKKKGRPVTQCEQCRELRKTKQVHVKCICPKGEGSGQASNSLNKTLQKPAFPNGLPQASIAVQHLSESSSDSEYGMAVSLL
ncbi:transcription factor [Lentinula edodes]|nr:transcription factor [Lentinula edodes]